MLSTNHLLRLLSQYWWTIPVGIIVLIILIKLLPRY